MGFCSKCGNQLEEGADFCPKCGNPANGGITSFSGGNAMNQNNPEFVRMNTLAEFARFRDYFSQKASQYEELDEASEIVKENSVPLSKARRFWGIMIMIFGFICIPIGLADIKGSGFAEIIGGIGIMTVGFLLFFSYVHGMKKRKENVEKYTKRHEELYAELKEYYLAYGVCPVGIEYTTPSGIEALGNVFREGSAYTFKEAVQVIKDDEHRANLETIELARAVATQNAADAIRRL